MLYEALADLVNYVCAIGLAWFGVVSFSVPFVVNEALNRSERYREWASKLAHPVVRRVSLFGLLLFSVFWAGFLAWREEHSQREALKEKYNSILQKSGSISGQGGRLQFYVVDQGLIEGQDGYNVKVSNIGIAPAYIDTFRGKVLVSDHRLSVEEYSPLMADLEEQVMAVKPDQHLSLELNPNRYQSYGFLAYDENGFSMPSNKNQEDIVSGKKFMTILLVTSYQDESIFLNNQRKIMRYCGVMLNGGPSAIICPGQNRTYISNFNAD